MSFTYNAWMPTQQKHDLTELAKAARAKANGKTYEPKPYVHVKGRIIATMDSADLAALKLEAGVAEPQLVQDTSTWSMAAGVWTRDAGPDARELERITRSMRLASEHDAHVEAERRDALNATIKADSQRKADEAREASNVIALHQTEQLAAAEARAPKRSVAGRPRVDCGPCGKRHYVRAHPCGLTG